MLTFRLGANTYRVEKQWAKLPQNVSLNNVSGVSVNTKGQIMVLQRSNPFMLIFSKEGDLIDQWGNDTVLDGHYFRVAKDGRVIVVDRDYHRVVVFSAEGEVLQILGGVHESLFNHPTDVDVNKNGEFFVSDGYGNSSVHHFDPSGNLINTWGKPGDGPGEFTTPHAVLVDKNNRVLVSDRENNRVQIFDQNGKYIHSIKNVYHPMSIYEDKNGYIYVTDQIPRLSMFSPDGSLVGRCRTLGAIGHGVAVDDEDNVFISEMNPDCIVKLIKLK